MARVASILKLVSDRNQHPRHASRRRWKKIRTQLEALVDEGVAFGAHAHLRIDMHVDVRVDVR